tara:strand:+ start:1918 stop:2085 length:168 start_codon:yes stop_codon:yes gene_type:complete
MTKLEELKAASDVAYKALEAAYDTADEAKEAYWAERACIALNELAELDKEENTNA